MKEDRKDDVQPERRRTRLPQPDFGVYKAASAYTGEAYFFLGHSFNLDDKPDSKPDSPPASDSHCKVSRKEAISNLFNDNVSDKGNEKGNEKAQWITVAKALSDSDLAQVLSRFEYDLLSRLPESTLIGPAIGRDGRVIPESFTIWRKEMRRSS